MLVKYREGFKGMDDLDNDRITPVRFDLKFFDCDILEQTHHYFMGKYYKKIEDYQNA